MFLLLSDRLRLHLVAALSRHCQVLRRDGIRPPDELTDLLAALAATSGHERPAFAPDGDVSDAADVVLLGYDEAGRRLGVSPRTVRRLVSSGDLPSVLVGRSRRVRVSDIADYIERLGAA